MVGLEIYPVNSDQYAYLHECGVDYVTVFQETYNSDKYELSTLQVTREFGLTDLILRKEH